MKTKQILTAILIVIMATAIALGVITALIIIQAILAAVVASSGIWITVTGKDIEI